MSKKNLKILDTEERIIQITHNTLHYLANIYKAISEAQSKVDEICKKLLLDKQEVKDLKSMNDRVED